MKKIFLGVAACALFSLVSCNQNAPKANLKTDIDTVSYELGLANTDRIEMYLAQMQVDSTEIEDFLRGVLDGAQIGEDKKKSAYMRGLQMGYQMGSEMMPVIESRVFAGDSTTHFSMKNLLAGFEAGIHGKSALERDGKKVMPADAAEVVNEHLQALATRFLEARYGDKKKEAADFLAKVAKTEGVKSLPGGVYYKVLTEGTGEKPAANATLMVNYEGRLIDGKVFDSSKRGDEDKPVGMPIPGVIKGLQTALVEMPIGSEWEIYIPYDQGYGDMGRGDVIPPFSTLIFKIKVVELAKN